jgi:hypothetical protein
MIVIVEFTNITSHIMCWYDYTLFPYQSLYFLPQLFISYRYQIEHRKESRVRHVVILQSAKILS